MCTSGGSNHSLRVFVSPNDQRSGRTTQGLCELVRQTSNSLLSPHWLLACLITLLTPSLTIQTAAQSEAAGPAKIQDSVDAPQEHLARADAKKLAKYDVNRIGRRDIGRGVNIYSLKRERELGEKFAAVLDRSTRSVDDEVVSLYISRLAEKLGGNSDTEFPLTIRLVDSGDIPRAYGLPGGFLYVSRALILSADGEAELAGVMAHEIAHVAARHATRALTRQQLCRVMTSIALFAGPAGIFFEDAGGMAGPLSVHKFDRDAEYEADLLGVEYAYAAGYDPEAVVTALEKLHAIELARNAVLAKIPGYHLATKMPWHSKVARGFANYPSTEDRIRRLQEEIPVFLPRRNEYMLDTAEFEEVKSRMLASSNPVLRRHDGRDDKGPVLRRVQQDSGPRGRDTLRNLDALR